MGPSPTADVIRTVAPHPSLAGYVRSYVSIESHPAGSIQVAAIPTSLLLVTWGGAVQVVTSAAGPRPLPLVALSGPMTRSHRSVIEAGACGFHVQFTPTGARALLGEHAVPDIWEASLPPALLRWAEAVAEAPSVEARVALADAFWRARLPTSEAWSAAAVRRLMQTAGGQTVASLAETLGVSPRTLQRRFATDVGIGVKTFAQVERYRQSHGLLLRAPQATWTDVCTRFGYADQAHFVRAFRRFTGTPPTRWRTDEHGFDLGFGLREAGASSRSGLVPVRFVQDGG